MEGRIKILFIRTEGAPRGGGAGAKAGKEGGSGELKLNLLRIEKIRS